MECGLTGAPRAPFRANIIFLSIKCPHMSRLVKIGAKMVQVMFFSDRKCLVYL